MKVLAISDIHVDARTAGFERWGDVERAVGEAMAAAIEQRVDLFVFLGDLCDPSPSVAPRAAELAGNVAANLAEHGVASRWLVGNHDVIEDGAGTSTMEPLSSVERATAGRVVLLDKPSVEAWRGINIVALPYTPRSHPYSPADFIATAPVGDGPVLVLGHLNLESIEPGSETTDMPRGRDVFWPLDAIARAPWASRALLLGGHIHKPQVYRGVVIVGAIQRFTFGEEGNEPSYLVAEVA